MYFAHYGYSQQETMLFRPEVDEAMREEELKSKYWIHLGLAKQCNHK